MTSSLREALDAQARGIPALGDIDAALEQVGQSQRRRRALVAVVSGLAAAAALVWAAGLGSRSTDGAPVMPAPSGAPVITLEREPTDLALAPLTGGADVVVRGGVAGVQAISATQQRGNLFFGRSRLYGVSLSPDGRYLAWSGSALGSGDQLHITDLTSATEVFTEQIVAANGGDGQTPRMEWSGDSRTLAMVVLETARMEVDPVGEVQLLQVRADGRVETAAAPIDLPGLFVGVDRTGTTLLAESSSGTILARRSPAGGWAPAGASAASAWPAGLDTPERHAASWWAQGRHRLSPDGQRVAWVQGPGGEQRTESMIGWVSLATGEWTTWTVQGADVSCLGWRGDELLLAVRGASATDVVAVDPSGAQRVLVTYAVAQIAFRTLSGPEVHLAVDRFQP